MSPDPSSVLAKVTLDLFASVTRVHPRIEASQWMAPWVLLMYEPDERARLASILTKFTRTNRSRLGRIFGPSTIRGARLEGYLVAPATLAVLERVSTRPMLAAHIWRQGLGTPDDLADLAALVGVGI